MMNESIKQFVSTDRINDVSPDYFEVLGTDRFENVNLLFGPAFVKYRKAWIDNPKNLIVGDFPLHLDVEITNTCNLRCEMCQIPFGRMEKGYMDIEIYKKIIKEAKKYKLSSIKFNFRGEPLMHPNIVEFVKLAKEAKILEAQFNTNGSLLNDDLSKMLIDAGLDRIKFSVDSVTPGTYNLIRRGTTFEKTISKILKFIEIRDSLGKQLPSIQVQMVYMEPNKDEIRKYIRFWENKVNRIGFSRYRTSDNRLGKIGRAEYAIGERFPCHQLWQRLVILWGGTVLMCCGDHNAKNPLGNIKDRSIVSIWKGAKLRKIRELHIKREYDKVEACAKCEVNYL